MMFHTKLKRYVPIDDVPIFSHMFFSYSLGSRKPISLKHIGSHGTWAVIYQKIPPFHGGRAHDC